MKKIIKVIVATICGILGSILLWETIKSLKQLDPWGLGFIFFTLPLGVFSILLLTESYLIIKQLIQQNKKKEEK